MQIHPYALVFPSLDEDDFMALVASIRDHGLQEPIVTYEGKVLDGRNRLTACSNARVKPVFREYEGDDPIGYVFRANLDRRHLTVGQRAMIGEKMANLTVGQSKSGTPKGVAHEDVAKALHISLSAVDRARVVSKSGDKALIKAVESGAISITAAVAKVAGEPEPVSADTECKRLLKLWRQTSKVGQRMFLVSINRA
jgi:hypothetical protein